MINTSSQFERGEKEEGKKKCFVRFQSSKKKNKKHFVRKEDPENSCHFICSQEKEEKGGEGGPDKTGLYSTNGESLCVWNQNTAVPASYPHNPQYSFLEFSLNIASPYTSPGIIFDSNLIFLVHPFITFPSSVMIIITIVVGFKVEGFDGMKGDAFSCFSRIKETEKYWAIISQVHQINWTSSGVF